MFHSLPVPHRLAGALASALLAVLGCAASPAVVHAQDFAWSNVAIGGGGYVSGLFVHPADASIIYARTDVGGAYSWNGTTNSWTPLTDWLTSRNLYCVVSLAIDPHNPDLLYMACGDSLTKPCGIYKSADRGLTWSAPAMTDVVMWGNDPTARSGGERLVVDPNLGGTLYYGSNLNGLYKSTDGGATWGQVTVPNIGQLSIGIVFVAIDPKSGSSGVASKTIYIGVYGTAAGGSDGGIYKSTDAGANWTKLGGAIANHPRRGQVASDGTLWVTHDLGVVKCNTAGVLTDVTPPAETGVAYNALATDPSKVAVMRRSGASGNTLYYTTNGGSNWTAAGSGSHPSSIPWWTSTMWAASPAAIILNPSGGNELWYSDWYGVWKTNDFTVSSPAWQNLEVGHEELEIFALTAPPSPSAELISGCADVDGFRHTNVTAYPSQMLGAVGASAQDTYALDYAGSNANLLARCSGRRSTPPVYYISTSTDNGSTWTSHSAWSSTDQAFGVAVSQSSNSNFVVTVGSGFPKYTTDTGATFTTCSGIAETNPTAAIDNLALRLAADRVTAAKFYYYVGGKVYLSTNGGASFAAVKTGLPDIKIVSLKTVPNSAGEFWMALGSGGLWHGTNSGSTVTEVLSPNAGHINSSAMGFGKQRAGSRLWMYLYGTIDGTTGAFVSKDGAASWTQITTPFDTAGDGPVAVEGSQQTPGRVFIGSKGRSIYESDDVVPMEVESLQVYASSGDNVKTASDPLMSGASGTTYQATSVGDYITFTVPNVTQQTYDIRVGVKDYNTRGIFQLAIGTASGGSMTNVGSPQDSYSSAAGYREINCGTWTPGTTSNKTFRFTVTGKNAASSGYTIGLDYIRLIPQ